MTTETTLTDADRREIAEHCQAMTAAAPYLAATPTDSYTSGAKYATMNEDDADNAAYAAALARNQRPSHALDVADAARQAIATARFCLALVAEIIEGEGVISPLDVETVQEAGLLLADALAPLVDDQARTITN